ncbi:hypothetical protein DM38_1917 [Brucella suis]|nr:hypothetical protein DM38_1917 [Brucella suis]
MSGVAISRPVSVVVLSAVSSSTVFTAFASAIKASALLLSGSCSPSSNRCNSACSRSKAPSIGRCGAFASLPVHFSRRNHRSYLSSERPRIFARSSAVMPCSPVAGTPGGCVRAAAPAPSRFSTVLSMNCNGCRCRNMRPFESRNSLKETPKNRWLSGAILTMSAGGM